MGTMLQQKGMELGTVPETLKHNKAGLDYRYT